MIEYLLHLMIIYLVVIDFQRVGKADRCSKSSLSHAHFHSLESQKYHLETRASVI
jgi:hypothetical protein